MTYQSSINRVYLDDKISNGGHDVETASAIDSALLKLQSNVDVLNFLNLPKENAFVTISVSSFDVINHDTGHINNKIEGFLSLVLYNNQSAYYRGNPTIGEAPYDGASSLISAPSSSVEALLDENDKSINGFDGNAKHASLERVLFHEISHRIFGFNHNLYSFLTYHSEDGQRQEAYVSYQENLAIMAENFLYVPYARSSTSQIDDDYRLGHTPNTGSSPGKSGGVSGMDAFDAFNQGRRCTICAYR